ncbi:unnamed protein product [Owenia fusiformis]|uniref:Uncharacterized protein n=1 Tax=Owenia fusiformis TaxID=6347 RepID=A0A8J1U0V3_OWEFU|nr:unnamed protein product [Owenia fusiformis]
MTVTFSALETLVDHVLEFSHIGLCIDANVQTIYVGRLSNLENKLKESGKSVQSFVVQPGEQSKCREGKSKMEDFFLKHCFPRNGSCLIAIGGGVVGDLVGFVAATYMRGIAFVQVPTTLLAMVDSSIGGKVGIDHPCGKNLLGAFYHPLLTLIDVSFAMTLPQTELSNGMAEAIKTALVADQQLWAMVKDNDINSCKDIEFLTNVVKHASSVKVDITTSDNKEQGLGKVPRQVLNFGHTIGHAIEIVSGLPHGQCVAMGIACEIMLNGANGEGLVPCMLQADIIRTLERYRLPVFIPAHLKIENIMFSLKWDKKCGKLATIKGVQKPVIIQVNKDDIIKVATQRQLTPVKEILLNGTPDTQVDNNNGTKSSSFDTVKIYQGYQPVILIGMKCSGKTTNGRFISANTGKQFIDMDEYFTTQKNITPGEWIQIHGFSSFHEQEYECLKDVIAMGTYEIIATGGGVVEHPKSRAILKAKKYVIHLKRPLSKIEADLADVTLPYKQSLSDVWEYRKSLYDDCATYVYHSRETSENVSPSALRHWLDNILQPRSVPTESFMLCFDPVDISIQPLAMSRAAIDADLVELRADLLEPLDESTLESAITGLQDLTNKPILLTFRSVSEGGAFIGDPREYINLGLRLGVEWIDIELSWTFKVDRRHARVIGSYHAITCDGIRAVVCQGLARHKPDVAKIVLPGNEDADAADTLNQLQNETRIPWIVITKGGDISSRFSRVVNKCLTPVCDPSLTLTDKGQLSIREIKAIRSTLDGTSRRKKFYLFGDKSVVNSPSPWLHNTAFEHGHIDAIYNICYDPKPTIIDKLKDGDFGGASVTIPYKLEAMSWVDAVDQCAVDIGAINTIYWHGEELRGCNTDWEAIYKILREVSPQSVVILGSGGTARAAAYACNQAAISFTVCARNVKSAEQLVSSFNGVGVLTLEALEGDHAFAESSDTMIINALPGTVKPPVNAFKEGSTWMDCSYGNPPRDKFQYIDGYKMLVLQAEGQYRKWFNDEMSIQKCYSESMNDFITYKQ